MKYLNRYRDIGPLLLATFFFATCNTPTDKKPLSFNPEIFHIWDSIGRAQGLVKASQYIDSVYRQISSPGMADKVFYYKEKLRLLAANPPYQSDSTGPLPLRYLDTLSALIKESDASVMVKKIYAEALMHSVSYLYWKKEYGKAKMILAEARVLGNSLRDTCYLLEVSRTFGKTLARQNDFKAAARYFKEGLNYLEKCQDNYYYNKQRILDDLGFVYRAAGNLDSAVYYHLQAVDFLENNASKINNASFQNGALSNIYTNIAYAYQLGKKLPQSITYYTKADKLFAILKDTVSMAEIKYWLASIFLEVGKLDTAVRFIHEAEPYAERLDTWNRNLYYSVRVKLAEELKNQDDLVFFQKKKISMLDTALNELKSLQVNNPELEYEKLDKQYQTQLLQRDNRIQRNKTTAAVLIGSVLLIGIVLSVWLLSRLRQLVKHKEELNHELQAALAERGRIEKELREKELSAQEMELNMEFQAAILEQRRQISDDMHDELSSSLAALKFLVTDLKEQAGGGEPGKILGEIEAEVSSVYTNARGYMHSLKTNDWRTRFSLTGLLRDVQQKFRQKNLMDVVLKIDEEGIKHRLSTFQHDQLYHITKECVSNVIKHANATRLEIRVLFGHGVCHFEIQDNGRGFDENKVMRGIGLDSMAKRVTGMGGTVDIQSSGMGTTISGNFPVD